MPTCEIIFSGTKDGRLGVIRREDDCTVSGAFLWGGVEIKKFRERRFFGIFNKDEIYLKIYDY